MLGELAGLAGGAFGQLGGALSAPRRYLWSALGIPEEGSQAVGQLTGMDPESTLAQALGIGLEILGDPLNLISIPAMSRLGLIPKMLRAQKAARAAEGGLAAEEILGAPLSQAASTYRPEVLSALPDVADLSALVRHTGLTGNKVTKWGEPQWQGLNKLYYGGVTPEAEQMLGSMYLGHRTPQGAMAVPAMIEQQAKAFKAVPPEMLRVSGGRLGLSETAPKWMPGPMQNISGMAAPESELARAIAGLQALKEQMALSTMEQAALAGGTGYGTWAMASDMMGGY